MGGGIRVTYYVIPRELAHKYYKEFKKRFAGVEGVEVIIDRRDTDRRSLAEGGGKRMVRDRRRRRASGSFPEV
jgi:ribosomal protein L34